MFKLKLIGLVMLLSAASQGNASELIEGKVVSIADGDTVTVLTAQKETHRVRLEGIDCPERKQPWGTKATSALKDVAALKQVRVEVTSRDQYGRYVGRVFSGHENLNQYMVKTGNCWVWPKYATDKALFVLHDQAKAAGLGLWKLPESERVAPWEWRWSHK